MHMFWVSTAFIIEQYSTKQSSSTYIYNVERNKNTLTFPSARLRKASPADFGIYCSNHRTYRRKRIITKATINFNGKATSELEFIQPSNSFNDHSFRSLPSFLNESACNAALLGGSPSRSMNMLKDENENILWSVEQPPISLFGSNLLSSFVSEIDRSLMVNEKLIVSIVDASTRVETNDEQTKPSTSAKLIKKIMDKSSFLGDATYTWKQSNDHHGTWTLEANLNLTLKIELPRFFLLPPGFNKIGSTIVNKTCKKQIEQSLSELNNAYLEWVTDTQPVHMLER